MIPFKPTEKEIDAFKSISCLFISFGKGPDGKYAWNVTDPHSGKIIAREWNIHDIFNDPFYDTFEALLIFDEEEE